MVSAELLTPSLVMVAGLNDAVAPVGRPDALSVTVWALPLTSGAVIVDDPDTAPCTALTELGDADTEKSFVTGALTIKVMVIPVVNDEAPVPVTVTEAGFADNVKELALTVNVTVVVCVADPVPVTVTG